MTTNESPHVARAHVYARVRVRQCASPAFTAVVRMNLVQELGGRECVSGEVSDP